jgi:hypothetical protein
MTSICFIFAKKGKSIGSAQKKKTYKSVATASTVQYWYQVPVPINGNTITRYFVLYMESRVRTVVNGNGGIM